MSKQNDWAELAARLENCLHLTAAPIGITFLDESAAAGAPGLDLPKPEATRAGRTGSVPAGCVFWMKAQQGPFTTVAADHANCSVGSYTHGFLTLREAAAKDDVAAILESGWTSEAAVAALPRVHSKPACVVYGPLAQLPVAPDVVLLRIDAAALMTLESALPELRIEGKPQCHIIAIAKEGVPAASVGCALSRARTGMKPEEMTCALPGVWLRALIAKIEAAAHLDRAMARYASADARRFIS
jgi:uncharacterized protein (DUF169 family)